MKIALIAHDKKKSDMVRFAIAYESILAQHELFSTGTTGTKIIEATSLQIKRFRSGPLGGDQQIGALVAKNEIDLVLFFRDPLSAQAHEPDITALIRLCDVYEIPLATNIGTGEILVKGLARGDFEWRNIINEKGGSDV
jgi:methylglyoxal synthase